MKFLGALCLALCLFVVACHGVPVERETLLSIEKAQPVAVPQQLRRVARHGFGGGFGGPGFGGYGGYPIGGYGGYGGYPIGGYGGYGGYPIGGFSGSSSSASASSSSGSYPLYG
ncbi:prisilkin-39-like [Bactrocera tryoni]|uniref:prisilkin-39-like n=1 Tax=Bactrocera tryoni TaxID=59916 RepID=UPI001A95CABE|nr:prisilkin-39-like [Bactrocera tryoni]